MKQKEARAKLRKEGRSKGKEEEMKSISKQRRRRRKSKKICTKDFREEEVGREKRSGKKNRWRGGKWNEEESSLVAV